MSVVRYLPEVILEEFRPYAIVSYRLWTLLVYKDQHYLGRSYLWLNRPGEMQDISDLTEEETLHLSMLIKKYKEAACELWQPDLFNYAWLGNETHIHQGHGHMHIIPRYKKERQFAGERFVDERWGQNYVPYSKFPVLWVQMEAIRDALQKRLRPELY